MNHDFLLVDFVGDDDLDNNVYDYTDNHKYQKCKVCRMNYNINHSHCCQCGNKWKDKSQIYCDKCYKTGIISFNMRGVDITPIVPKFNGYGKLLDIRGQPIFIGYLKNGKYNNDGTLYLPDGKLKYKGDFYDGSYNGFGVLVENNTFINAVFKNSKIIFKLKEFPQVKNIDIDTCHLCADDFDETERFPICGSKKCMECCTKCIKSFFENINAKRGSMLTSNMLLCPFCRNEIADDIIKIYNPELGKYITEIKKLQNPKEIVGLCSECNEHEIRELNIECGEQANKEKFICQKCIETKSFENVKSCPNCNIKVYKLDGCHWMKCKCNKAWCWHCLAVFDIAEGHVWNCKICGKGT
jgi:hypothetical protein